MDATTFRILNVASAYLGNPLSINQFTEKIREIYGTAHYVNIYRKIHDLQRQSILNLNKSGKSYIVELNFRNYLLIDFLAEMEIKKKIKLLEKKSDLQILLTEMEKSLSDILAIRSVCLVDFERNIKLNRIELLFLLKCSHDRSSCREETRRIYNELQKLQDRYNLKVDALILDESEFSDLIKSDENNPLKEILFRKTAFFCPQAFWKAIREIAGKGAEIRTSETQTSPGHISDADLAYNLARLGYREFGLGIEQGQKICIEYIVAALLIRGDARRVEAVPVILAKNRARSSLLVFLSQKYEASGRLLGLLRVLQSIKPSGEVDETIRLLETLNVKETQADESSISRKMRLYNAA